MSSVRRSQEGRGLLRAHQRVLQRGDRRPLRAPQHPHGPRAGTMDSVRSDPFDQIFRPDNFAFGQPGSSTATSYSSP